MNFKFCDDCGQGNFFEKDLFETIDGDIVCENCLNKRYTQCSNCSDYFSAGDLITINDKLYCANCETELFVICSFCILEFLHLLPDKYFSGIYISSGDNLDEIITGMAGDIIFVKNS